MKCLEGWLHYIPRNIDMKMNGLYKYRKSYILQIWREWSTTITLLMYRSIFSTICSGTNLSAMENVKTPTAID